MEFVRIFWKNNVQEGYLPKMSFWRQIVSEIVAQLSVPVVHTNPSKFFWGRSKIKFLNTPSQLVWVLASSGFYSITWRMISRSAGYKSHFQKRSPFRGIFFPCRCDIFRFFEFILLGNSSTAPVFLYNQINKQPENLYVNYRERFSYFTQLAETSLF